MYNKASKDRAENIHQKCERNWGNNFKINGQQKTTFNSYINLHHSERNNVSGVGNSAQNGCGDLIINKNVTYKDVSGKSSENKKVVVTLNRSQVSKTPICDHKFINGEEVGGVAFTASHCQSVSKLSDNDDLTKSNPVHLLSNLEENKRLWRERKKQKKEIKKQEKAVMREEEIHRKMVAPKDQKITIIDHITFNRMLLNEKPQQTVETKDSIYNSFEFPALEEVISPPKIRFNKQQKRNRSEIEKATQVHSPHKKSAQSEASEINEEISAAQSRKYNVTQELQMLETVNIISKNECLEETKNIKEMAKNSTTGTEDKRFGKKPKRKDPIHLNINDILKNNEAKLNNSSRHSINKSFQKMDIVRYSGNILDSDKPNRKRGKQREIPKAKKPSSLKQIILEDRAKRKELRNGTLCLQNNTNCNIMHGKVDITRHETMEMQCVSSQVKKENQPVESRERMSDIENSVKLLTISVDLKNNNYCKNNNVIKEGSIEKECDDVPDRNKNGVIVKEDSDSHKLSTDKSTFIREEMLASKIHSRKFREYCDHYITPGIVTATTALLEDIIRFHDRQFARNPLKATAKRRHITGLKEVRKFLTLRRVRLLVIAPDLERISSSGGLDDVVIQLKELAIANEVPYVFALGRKQLGYTLKKKVPVSCVGILSYEGTEHNFQQVMARVEDAREQYRTKVLQLSPPLAQDILTNQVEETPNHEDDVNKGVVASLLSKLSLKPNTSSPFLQAIEKCSKLKSEDKTVGFSERDQEVSEVDNIFVKRCI